VADGTGASRQLELAGERTELAEERTRMAEERTQLIVVQSIVGIMGFTVATSRVYMAVHGDWRYITWLWFAAAAAWFLVYFINEFVALWDRWTLDSDGKSTIGAEFKANVKLVCVTLRFLLAALLGVALVWTMVAIENDIK
jgi:uncharacterized membrane protein YidH (DUF202 family)